MMGIVFGAPSVGAEDAQLQLQIVAPNCQVSQVVENGETKNVFTPAGCENQVESINQTPVSSASQALTGLPVGQSSPVSSLLVPGVAPVSSLLPVRPQTPHLDRVASPSTAAAAVHIAAATVVFTATATVVASVGLAIGIHSAVAAVAASSSGATAVIGTAGAARRAKNKKPQ